MLTQQQVRRAFDYDEEGWLVDQITNQRVGSVKDRYVYITVNYKTYLAHRLIWLWHYGEFPDRVDHIDRDGFNNRIENLRECDQRQNSGNATHHPLRGIELHGRKWRVRITTDNGKIELGSYATQEEAIAARNKGYRDYFGEFFNEH